MIQIHNFSNVISILFFNHIKYSYNLRMQEFNPIQKRVITAAIVADILTNDESRNIRLI